MRTKTFTVTITSPYADKVTEARIKSVLSLDHPTEAIQVREVNKTSFCDGCEKEKRDVKAVGRDANGDADAPCLCFICRKEGARGRVWSSRLARYVDRTNPCGNISLAGTDL